MEPILEFASTAISISLVALGLLLLQRSHGIVILEAIPLATGAGLFLFAALHAPSASTLDATSLLAPTLACGALIFIAQPIYAKWRLRIAGESTTLLLSFALMNCYLSAMSVVSGDRAVSLGFADLEAIRTRSRLEWIIIILSSLVLAATLLYLHRQRLIAALQLSKDDQRLLMTFGARPNRIRRHVLVIALLLCLGGFVLYVSLQETFALSNYSAILIPGFAVAISQSRIRVLRIVATAFVLVSAERILTQQSTELLLEVHRAALFSALVVVAVISRTAQTSGTVSRWRRCFLRLGIFRYATGN